MDEPEFCFLLMHDEGVLCHPMELHHAILSIAPLGLNPNYMLLAAVKLIVSMMAAEKPDNQISISTLCPSSRFCE